MPTPFTDAALRVSAASAAWTITSSVIAIAVGLADGSLALVAFGAVQLFDFAADVVLVVHFRYDADHLEVVALRVVAVGLVAVGTTTAGVSVAHLASRHGAHNSVTSLVLAGTSVIALTLLALRKRHVAVRLPSAALRADGRLSSVAAALAGVTLVGGIMTRVFGWWWSDPATALVVAVGAVALGAVTYPRVERNSR